MCIIITEYLLFIEIEKSHGTTKLISDTQDAGSSSLAHHRQQVQPLPPPPPCCCQHIDYDEEEEEEDTNNNVRLMQEDDYDEVEGRYSPKKVTFSDYDQVKLMSMESLLSAATSDASTMDDVNGVGQMSGVPLRSVSTRPTVAPTVVLQDPTMFSGTTTTSSSTPKRNQKAQVRPGLV